MEKLSADALRLALVTASMEYYKKYVEGNQDFDNSEQIKEELDKYFSRFPFVFKGIDRGYQYMRSIGGSYKEEDYLHLGTSYLDQQITWTEHPQEYSDAMLAYRKRWNNTIDLSCEDFFKMKQFVQTGSKLQAVKHVKESAKCGLKEAKDFVDTYCDYVL